MARRRKNEKRQKSIRYFDYSLLFLIIFLLCYIVPVPTMAQQDLTMQHIM